ncbi:MAG: Dabb family protein [Bacteroidia bacterium]|nr:Dabb family protein [Bacteroidia bacterium]
MSDSFIHTVFFWLREPQNDAHRQEFEASIKRFLTGSEFAGSWHVGTPAGTGRTVVDNSYTYCLVVTFSSAANQDRYQTEPAHLKFIEEAGPLWERVQVYDSIALPY